MGDIKIKIKKSLSIILAPIIRFLLNQRILFFISKLDPKVINKGKNNFFTMHLRPKNDIDLKGNEEDYSDIGIIIQGPIEYQDDFTLNTVKLYKKIFKNAIIVVSTWDTEKPDYINKFNNENIKVILNEYPSYSGLLNMNYQIKNTKSAVNYLKNNCKYILKTRSDSRIYNTYALSYLKNLLYTFPANSETDEKFRIIGLNLNTSKYVPFSFSDILQFGYVNDIVKMWDIELFDYNLTYDEFCKKKYKIKDIYNFNNPEVFLTLNYLKSKGFNSENTYESYYKALSKFFIVIDAQMINYYWFKYSVDEFYWIYRYKSYYLQEKISFNDWLIYYNGINIDYNYSYFNEFL